MWAALKPLLKINKLSWTHWTRGAAVCVDNEYCRSSCRRPAEYYNTPPACDNTVIPQMIKRVYEI